MLEGGRDIVLRPATHRVHLRTNRHPRCPGRERDRWRPGSVPAFAKALSESCGPRVRGILSDRPRWQNRKKHRVFSFSRQDGQRTDHRAHLAGQDGHRRATCGARRGSHVDVAVSDRASSHRVLPLHGGADSGPLVCGYGTRRACCGNCECSSDSRGRSGVRPAMVATGECPAAPWTGLRQTNPFGRQ